ncbi:MAG: serine protease, partial [Verrucomicrobiota bacterium]
MERENLTWTMELSKQKKAAEREHEHEREMNRAQRQVFLATKLDGLSEEAIFASAGQSLRRDFADLDNPEQMADLEQRIPFPEAEPIPLGGSREAPLGFGLEERRKAVGLVYAAVGETALSCLGTAWGINGNTVVTNAHIAAQAIHLLEKGLAVWIRFPDPSLAPFRVSALHIHPGFEAHMVKVGNKEQAIVGCDLAVMEVEGRLPYTLSCLSSAGADSIQVGDSIHYIGYPSEGLPGDGTNVSAPSPLYKPGTISNLTDFSFGQVSATEARLITFDAGIAGGASGSPLMNDRGDVIGVVFAGTMHAFQDAEAKEEQAPAERIASGALVNFAVRIDLLEELLGN